MRRSPIFGGGSFEIVVVASSLGGIDALGRILAPLPADFPAPIVVVQHLPARHDGYIPQILNRRTALAVHWAADGAAIYPGAVYVAPANHHLLVATDRTCRLSDAPRVNYTRPSADPLFASVATCCGARSLGIILTGRLQDGAAGATLIRRAGGMVIAQDPATCAASGMPRAAILAKAVHVVLPLDKIADAIASLVMAPRAAVLIGVPGLAP